ncbi:TolC family protein [bacterium]|nr:TolC family protein [bacterium]
MRRLTFILALLTCTAAFAETTYPLIQSDTPLSLDSLIAIGNSYNPAVRQAGFDKQLNKIGNLAAIGNFLPQISLGASFSENHFESPTYINSDGSVSTYPTTIISSELAIDDNGDVYQRVDTLSIGVPEGKTRSSSYNVSASLSLFEGGRRIFLYRYARNQAKINELSLLDAQKTLARGIAQQVVSVLSTQKLLDLNKKLRDQRKDAYDLAKARFDVGAVTELDVLQAEIELGSAENSIRSTERDLQAQREALNQLLGIDLRSSYPIAEATDITPYQFDVEQLIESANQYRTDLEIAVRQINQAKHSLNAARSDYLPRLTIGATRSRSEQSGAGESFTLNPRNKNTSYWLSASWNLFDGFTREYNIATYRVARNRALENERDLRLSIEKSVRDAYSSLATVFDQMQTTERNRDLAERTLNLERERYRLGATSALSLRDAQVTYAQAETDNLSKQLEYQSTLIALELAVGQTLR